MTRREQILEAAKEALEKRELLTTEDFEKGAEWADQHVWNDVDSPYHKVSVELSHTLHKLYIAIEALNKLRFQTDKDSNPKQSILHAIADEALEK